MSIGPIRPQHAGTHANQPKPATERGEGFVRLLAPDRGRPTPASPQPSAHIHKAGATPQSLSGGKTVEQQAGMRALAERALDAEKRVEALIASAGSGRTFSAAELIALQATVFRYSQTVEVISRATDRLVGAIKQTLGTQV